MSGNGVSLETNPPVKLPNEPTITPQIVAQQFRGLGEQKVWDLCDRAFSKDLPGAIRSLKSIEAGGDDP